FPRSHEDDVPSAPAERADGRSGAAGRASLAGARAADRPRPHRPHAGGCSPADRGGVPFARAHGSLPGLPSAPPPPPPPRPPSPARDAAPRPSGRGGIGAGGAGRLAGYGWILTDDSALAGEGTETGGRELVSCRFPARRRFAREPLGEPRPFAGVVLADTVFTVEAAPLDHKIVSMAYAITERMHLNVRPDALAEAGLRPGPWLNRLKQALRAGAPDDTPIDVGPGDRRPLGVLRDAFVTVTPGQKVAYVVDTLFSPANAAAIVRLAARADVFFCEAPFLEEDLEQAARRYHL